MSRVAILSNAVWCGSGYGMQCALLARMLRKNGHDVAVVAFHGLQGAPLTWENGITVYPSTGEDPWALDVLAHHYKHFGADLLITLMDAWPLDPARLAEMAGQGVNIAHWMPVDCEPLSGMDRRVLELGGGRPIAMSRFGQAQLQARGFDALYVPHSLDMSSVWLPLEDKAAAREQASLAGKFTIGINAANQDPFRKGIWEQLAAFKEFAKSHADAVLVMHTRANTRQGVDLLALIADLGIGDRVMLGDQYAIAGGYYTEQQMASWHAGMDVCSQVSWAEGFGLAALQSQACGVPVIVGDNSAQRELCGAGWLVAGQQMWNKGHSARWQIPFIGGDYFRDDVITIIRAYELAYEQARDPALCAKARDFALAYDADRVYAEHWVPVLRELLPASASPPVATPAISLPEPAVELAHA